MSASENKQNESNPAGQSKALSNSTAPRNITVPQEEKLYSSKPTPTSLNTAPSCNLAPSHNPASTSPSQALTSLNASPSSPRPAPPSNPVLTYPLSPSELYANQVKFLLAQIPCKVPAPACSPSKRNQVQQPLSASPPQCASPLPALPPAAAMFQPAGAFSDWYPPAPPSLFASAQRKTDGTLQKSNQSLQQQLSVLHQLYDQEVAANSASANEALFPLSLFNIPYFHIHYNKSLFF